MISAFRFLVKANLYLLLSCIVFAAFAVIYGGLWNIIPYIFMLFFCFEWNVAPKINKTWLFIDSLPLSLNSRFILRVVFPFSFCFFVFFMMEEFRHKQSLNYLNIISDAIRQTSVFLLSSLIAESIGSYILYIIMLSCFVAIFSFFDSYIIFLTTFTFSYSYFILSNKRVSKILFLQIPILASILILLFSSFFKDSFCKSLLYFPVKSIQTYAVNKLINENIDVRETNLLPFGFYESFDAQLKLSDNTIEKMESVTLSGDSCSDTCHKLSNLMKHYPNNWNLERLSSYLDSREAAKQIYALELIHSSNTIIFVAKLIQMTHSENPEISKRAIAVLDNWGIYQRTEVPDGEVF